MIFSKQLIKKNWLFLKAGVAFLLALKVVCIQAYNFSFLKKEGVISIDFSLYCRLHFAVSFSEIEPQLCFEKLYQIDYKKYSK